MAPAAGSQGLSIAPAAGFQGVPAAAAGGWWRLVAAGGGCRGLVAAGGAPAAGGPCGGCRGLVGADGALAAGGPWRQHRPPGVPGGAPAAGVPGGGGCAPPACRALDSLCRDCPLFGQLLRAWATAAAAHFLGNCCVLGQLGAFGCQRRARGLVGGRNLGPGGRVPTEPGVAGRQRRQRRRGASPNGRRQRKRRRSRWAAAGPLGRRWAVGPLLGRCWAAAERRSRRGPPLGTVAAAGRRWAP